MTTSEPGTTTSAPGTTTAPTGTTSAPTAAPAPDAHPAASPDRAVRVRGLGRAYGTTRVLDGLDLDVAEGELVAVVGRSGCGKSTLLRVLAGLDRDAREDVLHVPERVGVVFQEPRLLAWERTWRTVLLSDAPVRAADRPRAVAALAQVGLADLADRRAGTLSGGQAQRVALARALAREPDLLLLDEPFAALDALTRREAHALVRRVRGARPVATVLVTHDVDEAVALADRVLVLADGRVTREVRPGPGAADALLAALGVLV